MSDVFVDPVRRPGPAGSRIVPPATTVPIPRPAQRITDTVCDRCPEAAASRCLRERLCWLAETDAIRAERERAGR